MATKRGEYVSPLSQARHSRLSRSRHRIEVVDEVYEPRDRSQAVGLARLKLSDVDDSRAVLIEKGAVRAHGDVLRAHRNIVKFGAIEPMGGLKGPNRSKIRWAKLKEDFVESDMVVAAIKSTAENAKKRRLTLQDRDNPEFSASYMIPGLSGAEQFEWNTRRKQEVWERAPIGKEATSRRAQLERLRWLPPMDNAEAYAETVYSREVPYLSKNYNLGDVYPQELLALSHDPGDADPDRHVNSALKESAARLNAARTGKLVSAPVSADPFPLPPFDGASEDWSRGSTPSSARPVPAQSNLEMSRTGGGRRLLQKHSISTMGAMSDDMVADARKRLEESLNTSTTSLLESESESDAGGEFGDGPAERVKVRLPSYEVNAKTLAATVKEFEAENPVSELQSSLLYTTNWVDIWNDYHVDDGSKVKDWRTANHNVRVKVARNIRHDLYLRERERMRALEHGDVFEQVADISLEAGRESDLLRGAYRQVKSGDSIWHQGRLRAKKYQGDTEKRTLYDRLLQYVHASGGVQNASQYMVIKELRRCLMLGDECKVDRELMMSLAAFAGPRGAVDRPTLSIIHFVRTELGIDVMDLFDFYAARKWPTMCKHPASYKGLPWVNRDLDLTDSDIRRRLEKKRFGGDDRVASVAEVKNRAHMEATEGYVSHVVVDEQEERRRRTRRRKKASLMTKKGTGGGGSGGRSSRSNRSAAGGGRSWRTDRSVTASAAGGGDGSGGGGGSGVGVREERKGGQSRRAGSAASMREQPGQRAEPAARSKSVLGGEGARGSRPQAPPVVTTTSARVTRKTGSLKRGGSGSGAESPAGSELSPTWTNTTAVRGAASRGRGGRGRERRRASVSPSGRGGRRRGVAGVDGGRQSSLADLEAQTRIQDAKQQAEVGTGNVGASPVLQPINLLGSPLVNTTPLPVSPSESRSSLNNSLTFVDVVDMRASAPRAHTHAD